MGPLGNVLKRLQQNVGLTLSKQNFGMPVLLKIPNVQFLFRFTMTLIFLNVGTYHGTGNSSFQPALAIPCFVYGGLGGSEVKIKRPVENLGQVYCNGGYCGKVIHSKAIDDQFLISLDIFDIWTNSALTVISRKTPIDFNGSRSTLML